MIKSPISAKPIFHFSCFSARNSKLFLFQISHFSKFSSNSSSGASSPTTSYPSRRHEEESRNVRVSVWWDFENCNVPVGANVFRVAQSVTAAIRANGIKGPIQITAFGDVLQMSRQNQEALSSTGINLAHIPRGGKNSADRSLLVDLMYWVSQNPPPAHLFLISSDRDFSGILHRLRMNNYNILLASSENAPSVLCSAASIMWHWNSLLKGENLSGKHFNQPPDGPYNSWYGHYKASLEDPFAVLEQSTCYQASVTDQSVCLQDSVAEPSSSPQSEDLPDSVSESKVQPIPKAVVKQIYHILCQYHKGIPITELRAELSKSNLTIDKDFYGHKKFSKFLLAMPHILKLQSRNDGQFLVHSVTPKIPEQLDPTPGSNTIGGPMRNCETDPIVATKLSEENGYCSDQSDSKSLPSLSSGRVFKNTGKLQESSTTIQEPTGKPKEPPLREPKVKSTSTKQEQRTRVQELPSKVQEPSEAVQAGYNAEATESELHVIEQSSVSEEGFFRKIWRKCFGKKDNGAAEKIARTSHAISDEKIKTEGKDVKPTVESVELVGTDSSSCKSDEAIHVHDDSTSGISGPSDEKMKSQGSGSFNQFVKKLFWGSSAYPRDSGEFIEKMNRAELASVGSEILGEKTFWDELKAFLGTPEASAIVAQSRTRMQMVQNLQKQGPPVLLSLSEADLLDLAELTILDKKWIEESPMKTFPFKLVLADEKGTSTQVNISRQSNGLSSIFSNTQPSSLSQKLWELDGQKKHNASHTEVPEPVSERVPSPKSRSEILADCQKLLDEIVRKYPEGFNMSSFRKAFSERYGYSLDIQKLGYQKLATVLQVMSGVRIESTYILPAGHFGKSLDSGGILVQESGDSVKSHSDSYLSDTFGKEDDTDSPWEELGPVANSSSKKCVKKSPAVNGSLKDEIGQKLDHGYESLSDDNSTDSEEETPPSMKSESQKKTRINEEDSSLLQILDSWYSTKEDNTKKGASENLDGGADSFKKSARVSSSARSITNGETPVMNGARKQKPSRTYSFVKDQGLENNDVLIDGILGSLKKSGERSAETRI